MKSTNYQAIQELPNDTFCEDQILGLCLFNGAKVFCEASAYIRTKDIFYDYDNATIWESMCKMYQEGISIDMVTTNHYLIKNGKSISGDKWAFILGKKLENLILVDFRLPEYCLSLVELYLERENKKAVFDLANESGAKVLAKLESIANNATDFKTIEEWTTASELVISLLKRHEKIQKGNIVGVKTGFKELDLLTGGLEAGMIVMAARPSMGKTASACSIALNVAKNGVGVGIISLEMPDVQVSARLLSMFTNLPFWKVFRSVHQNNEDKTRFEEGIKEFGKLPLYTMDKTNVNLSDIKWRAENLVKKKGAKLLIIDYIQLIDVESEGKNTTREREVARLSKGIKTLSKDLDIPIIVLAQLNRESERSDKASSPGKLSQLRESDAILADADMGIIVDRPYKRGQTQDEHGNSTENIASLIIEKHRNGETKTINLGFNPETMCFIDSSYEKEINTSFKVSRMNFEPPKISEIPPPF